jgi:beta-galactosidase
MHQATAVFLLLNCLVLWAGPASTTGASPRIRENWNAGWLFARQSKGTGELGSFDRENDVAARVEQRFRDADKPEYDDSWWQSISLPHTWNAQDVMDQKPGYWRGIGWYRKHFHVDGKYAAKRIFLEFEGANEVAEFWLNGHALGVHAGGYTGFEFDITGEVRFGGEDNVLTVKVDNLFHATIPPTVKTDYSFYGGIYRAAWLRVSDAVYLADVHWTTPSVTDSAAEVAVESRITNTSQSDATVDVMHEIIDPRNTVVKSFTAQATVHPNETVTLTQKGGTLDHPQLWSPDAPALYRIRTSIRQASALLDRTEIPLGFRWYRFDPQRGFFLNGKRVQLQGTNWHQSYPGMGNALPKSRHVKDMEVIREMGANFWRTSHYPDDVSTMDASDRLGLMVWEELPINKEIGDPQEYTANVLNMAREMIVRDRNHPCVILWGIAGEINAPRKVSMAVVDAAAKFYRKLDPSRPVVMHAPRGDEIEALVDVAGLGVELETDQKHQRFPLRSYMVGEYAAALTGRGIYGDEPNSEDKALASHEKYLSELNQRPWMAGGAIWNQFDYDGESYDVVTPHIVAFGMADIWRIPKETYYFYQSQWSAQPMVHIVGHWTWPGQVGQSRSVKVYSNADEVELFLNGRSLGVQMKGSHQGSYPGLAHPPYVWNVQYQPGTLRAVARIAGREFSDERKTAGEPYQIILTSDADKLTSGDRESLAYITAIVADRNGVVVPTATSPVSFTSYGPGELLEQTWPPFGTGLTWNAVAGMTRIAMRSTNRSGRTVVSASSPGLRMGRIEIDVTAPGRPDEMNYKERFEVDELQ